MMLTRYLFLACIFLVSSQSSLAEVYRWVDEKGKVQFGDRPPTKDAEQVKIKPPPSSASPQGPAQPDPQKLQDGMLKAYDERKTIENEKRAKLEQQKAAHEKNCKKARAEYDDYDGYRRYNLDKDGNKVFMSDEEIQQDKIRLKQWIDGNCS